MFGLPSWKDKKDKETTSQNFTKTTNLTTTITNVPLSCTPCIKNVFALFLDINTSLGFVYPAETRGQASDALKTYIQAYGKPHKLIHDNAQEFSEGEFADICRQHSITQTRSPLYEPNHNPVEHYMRILVSMTRSLVFISRLDPDTFWTKALHHAVYIRIRTALPGRPTPFELTYGRRPDMTNLGIFGSEALSYVDKTKRSKLQPKVERTIYLGPPPDH
jgi:hypothetical protein